MSKWVEPTGNISNLSKDNFEDNFISIGFGAEIERFSTPLRSDKEAKKPQKKKKY